MLLIKDLDRCHDRGHDGGHDRSHDRSHDRRRSGNDRGHDFRQRQWQWPPVRIGLKSEYWYLLGEGFERGEADSTFLKSSVRTQRIECWALEEVPQVQAKWTGETHAYLYEMSRINHISS